MMPDLTEFLLWEATTRDTLDVKRIYIDMAGDLVAGVLLSQVVFWFLPNKQGESKLRVQRDGELWLAKRHEDWWEECRITQWQAKRAIRVLVQKGILVSKLYKFDGAPTTHLRINPDGFLRAWELVLQQNTPNRGKHSIPNEGNTRFQTRETLDSLTETTTETTTHIPEPDKKSNAAPLFSSEKQDFLTLSSAISLQQQAEKLPVETVVSFVSDLVGIAPPDWDAQRFEKGWALPAKSLIDTVVTERGVTNAEAVSILKEILTDIYDHEGQTLTLTSVWSFYNMARLRLVQKRTQQKQTVRVF
jgi:hypothetical protein